MVLGKHPRKFIGCDECGEDHETWEKKRRLPQIGPTYECQGCGLEVYAYTNASHTKRYRSWREVTDHMLINLQFWSVCEEWPDSATEDLVKQGLQRMEAIDWRVVEVEGVSQSEWADMTDRSQSTVSENVAKARGKLE